MTLDILRWLRKGSTIDLHTHTHYSDGRFSPAEVIAAAARRGMQTLAITDHDTLAGSLEAAPLAQAAGIELIPGLEITTRWPGAHLPPEDVNVDLLGYFVDPEDAEFAAFVRALSADVIARTTDCCELISARGYPLTIADVLAVNPRYAGALPLIEAVYLKEHAPSFREAAALVNDLCGMVRETPFTIYAAIEQIHLAGGVAVLAHPVVVRPNIARLSAQWLRKLVDAGLDGIEVYHWRQDKAARDYFLGLAREFNLLVTGGSDLHGWHHGLNELGTQHVTKAMLEQLKAKRRPAQGADPSGEAGAASSRNSG